MNNEMKFTHEDIVYFYHFFRSQLGELKKSDTELNSYFRKILPMFNDDSLNAFSEFFKIDRANQSVISLNEGWERFDTYFIKSLSSNIKSDFHHLPESDKEKHYLHSLQSELKTTILKHMTTFSISEDGVKSWKVEALYAIANNLGINKKSVLNVMKSVSTTVDKALNLISNMDERTQVFCYLYSIKSFLDSGKVITLAEKNAIRHLKKQFKLDIGGSEHWSEYINILEGNKEHLVYIDDEDELITVFAAYNLIAFEDEQFDKKEKDFILDQLKTFSLNKRSLDKLKDYKGKNLNDILNMLSPKGKVFLVIKTLSLICADGKIDEKEEAVIFSILKNLVEQKAKVDDGDGLYLLFIHFLFETPSICAYKNGEFITLFNKLLVSILGFKRDISKVFYLMESFQNKLGITHDTKILVSMLNCLGIDKYNGSILANECENEESQKYKKSNMLLALLKTDVLLDDDSVRPEFMKNLKDVLQDVPTPETYEKNAIAFFTLRAILLDDEVEESEMDFFDELAFSMKVDQSLIYKFIDYLFLETSVRYNFAGWIDYSEFVSKNTKKLKYIKYDN